MVPLIDINSVKQIARAAGAEILRIYAQTDQWAVEQKSDNSPLTLADRQANQLICQQLLELAPEIPIISEENKAIPYAQRKSFGQCWLVDPLDGTKEFVKRNGEFTVNIALLEGGRPILGVVYAPVLDEMYTAVRSEGAFFEQGNTREQLQTKPFTLQDSGLRVVCSRSHMTPATQAFVDQLQEPTLVSRGSSLKFLLLARGLADLYPRLAPTMEWDTGAAQMVLEEAGGCVVEASTGHDLAYNKENLLNPHFIAYSHRSAIPQP
ncbi:MAG: 3'(2'),5'-bisphosphate nucleotidase CysQ [Lewinellaceae bacterium]|nr:3'(2'),5'-bisphosphate nucleotidase CysQ [Lewinellaceae bacterium]